MWLFFRSALKMPRSLRSSPSSTCLLASSIGLPLYFPRDQPTLTFQSVYHFTSSGQLYSQVQKSYLYSPRWDGNKMAKRAKAYFKSFVPQFQEGAFTSGKLEITVNVNMPGVPLFFLCVQVCVYICCRFRAPPHHIQTHAQKHACCTGMINNSCLCPHCFKRPVAC